MFTLLFLLTALPIAPSDADLAEDTYRGITEGNWFLAAGAALALAVRVARPRLELRWPVLAQTKWRVTVMAACAGLAGLAHAWWAGARPDAETLAGAFKVFVAAAACGMTGRFLWSVFGEADDEADEPDAPPPQ